MERDELMNRIPDSFTPGRTEAGPGDQIAHPAMIEHSKRLVEKLYKVGENAWSYVGNGLSNQSFVEGPEGLIVIDTGECVEEMQAALSVIRQETKAPIVACIYTHFHYVGGTTAVLEASDKEDLPIYGHSGIEANLRRFGGEVGPRSARGLVHQFAVMLPEEGPDGLVNVGLGRFLRNPEHAPYTPGHIPAQHTFAEPTEVKIAGLKVHFMPAPSDATDSITIWFPELKLAVNNLLWPALFNVFAIRGEEYRDPRILLEGLDELGDLGAGYLIGSHGPPIEGRQLIRDSLTDYRDTIQYMWDQTVRGANLGLTLDELVAFVQLPSQFSHRYVTTQFYGLVEHHVRQIYCGLFGWFDEDESKLFPTPSPERAQKLIAGFGGKAGVRSAIDKSLKESDYRWAIELSTWLVRCELNPGGRADAGEQQDRDRLAESLRGVGQSTTSANVRNWCLTRALELEGTLNLERFRGHRFRAAEVLNRPAIESVPILKVLLVPERVADFSQEVLIRFDDGSATGLRIRNQVAVPTDGSNADITLAISHQHWAAVLGGKTALAQLVSNGDAQATPDKDQVLRFFNCFDLESLASS
jgi:alkyl sulfatase BDS1-like metallo-beta-lactamase superfamily hydrolase